MKRKNWFFVGLALVVLVGLSIFTQAHEAHAASPSQQLCYVGAGTPFWTAPWKERPAQVDGKFLKSQKALVPVIPPPIGSVRARVWNTETVVYLYRRDVKCIK